jgi:hypothetical protein
MALEELKTKIFVRIGQQCSSPQKSFVDVDSGQVRLRSIILPKASRIK